MNSHFMLGRGVALACAFSGTTALSSGICSAQTLTAADYATNAVYADGWQETDNGGFGFTPWGMNGTYTSAIQHAMDTNSIYNQLGVAWTLFLPNGIAIGSPNPPEDGVDLSRAGRGFPPLQVGQTISTVIDNPTERRFYKGYTIRLVSGGANIGYCCPGVSLLAVGTFEYFTYGRWYAQSRSPSLFDTNTAAAGMRLDVTLTGPDHYKLTMTPLNDPGSAYSEAGALAGAAGLPIDWIQFELYNTDSDFFPTAAEDPQATDFYIRSIAITEVQPVAPEIVGQPVSQTLYAGRTARFRARAIGTALGYRWQKNGTNLSNGGNLSGALTDNLMVNNVGSGDVAAYSLVASNSMGAVTSAPPATLTLVQPSGMPYENAVLAANPVAHWRLNELANPATNPPAFDYWGGLVGIYGSAATNGFNSLAGPQPPAWPGFEINNHALKSSAGSGPSRVTIPPLNLKTNTLTFTFWIHPDSDPIASYAGLIYTRAASTTAAGVQYTTGSQLGYTVNNDSATWGFQSGLVPPVNQWSFVAVVVEPSQATIYLYNTNDLASAVNVVNHENVAWDGSGLIGGDPQSADRTFDGAMDEVALFNYAFTPEQVLHLYNAALQVPVTLSIQKVGANIQLSWPQGTLLEATEITGPYTTNNAPSPYTFAPSGTKKFFRVRVQ